MDATDKPGSSRPNNKNSHGRIARTRYLLARSDQPAIAAILVLCLIGMTFYFWQRSVVENGLIDIDRAEKLHVEYRVDINMAPWPAIANLPGIGEKLARTIVEHREQHGPFRNASDLLQVSGVGEAKLRTIMPYLAPFDATAQNRGSR